MTAPVAALAQYDEQTRVTESTARAAALLWAELDPANVSGSWEADRVGDALFVTVSQGQQVAATSADAYADLMLIQQGTTAPAQGSVIPTSLAGIASDGRDLASLLLQPVITTATARAGGATAAEAMNAGLGSLVRIVGTQVQDAGRAAQRLAALSRVGGYVRAVHPGACGRCVILAGRWYAFDAGFDRHPLCKCYGIPAAEDSVGDPSTDPMAYFKSLSEEEQDKAFTKAGARAVRDGADISQVVNARRGALGLERPGSIADAMRRERRQSLQRVDVYGRRLAITSEGTTKRGLAGRYLIKEEGARASQEMRGGKLITRQRSKTPRLMPEGIYEIAANRDEALRLLTRYGYITSRLYDDARRASAAAKSAKAAYQASRVARGLPPL